MQEYDLKPEQIQELINGWTWSFSRVNSLTQCLYEVYLHYVLGNPSDDNCWAQFGTLLHKGIEMFLKGELDIFTAAEWYKDNFDTYVTCSFPSNKYVDLRQKSYDDGLNYFNNISFDFDKYEILGVEKEYHFDVGGYPFVGYVDALYRDKTTGEVIILDQKTSSFKYLKNGEISKTSMPQFEEFKKQESLYAIPILEEYGRVDYLTWNMIRDQREIRIPFDKDYMNQTIEWAVNNIQAIKNELLWLPDNSSSYKCNCICGQRSRCPYRPTGG